MKISRKKGVKKFKITHNKKLLWVIIILLIVLGLMIIQILRLEKNQIIPANLSCSSDNDCVASSCCHANSCVNTNYSPNCIGIRFTLECAKGTLDCGQASCVCINKKCQIKTE